MFSVTISGETATATAAMPTLAMVNHSKMDLTRGPYGLDATLFFPFNGYDTPRGSNVIYQLKAMSVHYIGRQ